MSLLSVRRLGITDCGDAIERMRAFTQARIADPGNAGDEIWLTTHPPVYTLGFASRLEHVRDPGDIPVLRTERGGQVTYHGPGQVVAYLMLDLRARRLGVRELVCRIEAGVIACLAGYGITAFRRDGAPGIFVPLRDPDPARRAAAPPATGTAPSLDDVAKIASIGLKVSRGFTWHGVAVNGAMDLSPFERIDPCGHAGLRMTDVRSEAAAGADFHLDPLGDRLAAALITAIEG